MAETNTEVTVPNVEENGKPLSPDVSEIVNAYKPPVFKHKKRKWQPKKWEPIYDEMVLMACMGRDQSEIARRFGYTRDHVCVILNTKQALVTKRLFLDKLQQTIDATIAQRIEAIKDKALMRIAQTLNDDELYKQTPIQVFDRSVVILKGVGVLKDQPSGGSGGNVSGNIFINADDAKGIREGLAVANEAKRLNSGEIIVEQPNSSD